MVLLQGLITHQPNVAFYNPPVICYNNYGSNHCVIEAITPGDLVYSTDPETCESEYKEVARVFRRESDIIIHVFVNGEEIETTPNHPFWVEDQWVLAKDLREGDVLTLADGTTATITKTYGEQLDDPVIVYNFEVRDFHTYYVGEKSVLVHNVCNGNWAKDRNGSSESTAEYHYGIHGSEVGATSLEDYTRKATNFANKVLNTKKAVNNRSYISGFTDNTYRYRFNGKYIDLAFDGIEHLIVSFGLNAKYY